MNDKTNLTNISENASQVGIESVEEISTREVQNEEMALLKDIKWYYGEGFIPNEKNADNIELWVIGRPFNTQISNFKKIKLWESQTLSKLYKRLLTK